MPPTTATQTPPASNNSNVLALASFFIAIAAIILPLILGVFVLLSAPLSIGAIVVASISLAKKRRGAWIAIIGLILGIIALLMTPSILISSLFMTGLFHSPLGIW